MVKPTKGLDAGAAIDVSYLSALKRAKRRKALFFDKIGSIASPSRFLGALSFERNENKRIEHRITL